MNPAPLADLRNATRTVAARARCAQNGNNTPAKDAKNKAAQKK